MKWLLLLLLIPCVLFAQSFTLNDPAFCAASVAATGGGGGGPSYSTNTVTYSDRNAWGSTVTIPFANISGTWEGMEFIMEGFTCSNPSGVATAGTDGGLGYYFPFESGMGGSSSVSGIKITLSSFSAYSGAFTNNGVYALPSNFFCPDEGCYKYYHPNGNNTIYTALESGTFTTTSWTLNLIYSP